LPDAIGAGGKITIAASRALTLLSGGLISSRNYGAGRAGSIAITASTLTFDSRGNYSSVDLFGVESQTGIFTCGCLVGGTAETGAVAIDVTGRMSLLDGAQIGSKNYGSGSSGPLRARAGSMILDEGISPNVTGFNSAQHGTQAGADIEVAVAGDLTILSGAQIAAFTFSPGHDGSVKVRAASLFIDEKSSPFATGIASEAVDGSSGDAGNLDIAVSGNVTILRGGSISSGTFAKGAAGSIKLSAGSMQIDGLGSPEFTGVGSQAEFGTGRGGNMDIAIAGDLTLMPGGIISSGSLTSGAAGSINLSAGSILLDGKGVTKSATAILSQASGTGNAGGLDIQVRDRLTIRNGAEVSSATMHGGDGGLVKVNARSIEIDGQDNHEQNTGILGVAFLHSTGRAGNLQVHVTESVSIVNGGFISSDTNGSGAGGSVNVNAANVVIDNAGSDEPTAIASTATSSGNGGDVTVSATGKIAVLGRGLVGASSGGAGTAGSVNLTANEILIDARNDPHALGVQATSFGAGSPGAGSIDVIARDNLALIRGGYISVSTSSPSAKSGSIAVDAGNILIDGAKSRIIAGATEGSSGQTGTVTVHASRAITVSNGAALSIRNDASVADPSRLKPTLLSVSAPSIALINDAEISAASGGNVAASDIQIHFGDRLLVDPSRITTSAAQGNGGAILIDGTGVLLLDHTPITTSAGPFGNGGDIAIHANALVMKGGFIQANTEGVGARGGNVGVDVRALVASGGTLIIGGTTPLTFQPNSTLNVIQAAAPTGVSGTIDVNTPVLDISGSLHGLSTEVVTFGKPAEDLCRVGAGSSLTPLGRGGMRPIASGPLRSEGPVVSAQTQRIDAREWVATSADGTTQPASSRCER
jgi:large exoprotein involved in heme utilization and adhesion